MDIWTSNPPYRFEGEFTNYAISEHIDHEMHIGSLLKPLQQPLPPIFVPSISRASKGLKVAAARGFSFISHHMIHTDVLKDQVTHTNEVQQTLILHSSPENWAITRNIVVANTDEQGQVIRSWIAREVHRLYSGIDQTNCPKWGRSLETL